MYKHFFKRLIDIVLSGIGIIVLIPIWIILFIAIKIDSRGPIFFKQKRIGIHKKTFNILKFRTMRIDTPHDVPTHMLENPEQWITRVGKFLRKTSLDELPQIFNIIDAVNIIYCVGKLKMEISFRNPNFRLLKEIFVFSFFIALNQIIDQINWQTDKVILGKVVNGSAVAVYAVGAQINSMFTSFSVAISGVFAPKVNMIVQEQKEDCDNQLTDLFIKVGRLQWYILALILTGFVFFGQFFISRWAGEGYENAYWVALLLMTPAIIPLIQNIGIEIQRAKNKHQFRSVVYAIMAVMNVGISIWFAMLWGEVGTAIGTTISLLVANGLIMNIYYQKKLGINVLKFWKLIIKTLPGMILPVAVGTFLMLFYNFNSLLDFSLLILAYAVLYSISLYLFGINRDEKLAINGLIKKVVRK
ncbi:MAG: sugar transferase [Clostridia bacterium]|nr:sugar transferase [Clostridia bacterium]